MSNKHKYRHFILTQVIIKILSFGVSIFFIRWISPSIFGLIAMILPILMCIQVLNSGTINSVISRKNLSILEFSSFFYAKLLFSGVLLIVVFTCSPLIVTFYHESQLYNLVIFYTISTIIATISDVFIGTLYRESKFNKIAYIEITAFLISTTIAIGFIINNKPLTGLVLKELTSSLIFLCLSFIYSRWNPVWHLNFKEVEYFFRFGLNTTIDSLLSILSRNLDDILIGRKFGSAQLGIYSKSYSLLVLPHGLISNIALKLGMPKAARSNNLEDTIVLYKSLARLVFTVNMPLAIFFYFTSEALVRLIFGDIWLPMVPFLQLFSVLSILQAIGPLANLIYLGKNKTKHLTISSLLINGFLILAIVIGFIFGESAYDIAIVYTVGVFLLIIPSLYILAIAAKTKLIDLLEIHFTSSLSGILVGILFYFLIKIEIDSFIHLTFYGLAIFISYFLFLYLIDKRKLKTMYHQLRQLIYK